MTQIQNVQNLISRSKVEIQPETFTLISLKDEEWIKLVSNPALSPRMTSPFMIFRDAYETTLLLDEIDFVNIRNELANAKIESNFRLLTFDVELDFSVIGFTAEISRILAEAKISIIALSAFSRDHILVKQNDLAKALKVLGEVVEDLC